MELSDRIISRKNKELNFFLDTTSPALYQALSPVSQQLIEKNVYLHFLDKESEHQGDLETCPKLEG